MEHSREIFEKAHECILAIDNIQVEIDSLQNHLSSLHKCAAQFNKKLAGLNSMPGYEDGKKCYVGGYLITLTKEGPISEKIETIVLGVNSPEFKPLDI